MTVKRILLAYGAGLGARQHRASRQRDPVSMPNRDVGEKAVGTPVPAGAAKPARGAAPTLLQPAAGRPRAGWG